MSDLVALIGIHLPSDAIRGAGLSDYFELGSEKSHTFIQSLYLSRERYTRKWSASVEAS